MASFRELAVRSATLLVLTISDADFLFSFLFMYSLIDSADENVLLGFLPLVVCVGMVSYFVGVIHYGPKKKRAQAKQVMEFWRQHPLEVQTKKWKKNYEAKAVQSKVGRDPVQYVEVIDDGTKVGKDMALQVTMDMPVFPVPPATGKRYGSFNALNLENEDEREALRQGFFAWGIASVWDQVEAKHAHNQMKRTHGIPFLRLAAYGFQAQPSPKDLSGILNANALYTCACGVMQILLGSIILATNWSTSSYEDKLYLIVPLGVSSMSFVLSILNVLMDFSGMLVQMENEKRMKDAILAQQALVNKAKRASFDDEHQRREAAIDEKFQDLEAQLDPGSNPSSLAVRRQVEHDQENQRHLMAIDQLNQNGMNLLEIDLTTYRKNLKRIDRVMSGRGGLNNSLNEEGEDMIAFRLEKAKSNARAAIGHARCKKVETLTRDWKAGRINDTEYEEGMQQAEEQEARMMKIAI